MQFLLFLLLFGVCSSSTGEVVITSFPSTGFIIRNEPFLLSCTAINAISIRFRCNHKWMNESRQLSIEGVDEGTGIRYLESSINISRSGEENEERCDCYGVGKGERTVKSDKEAIISTAYMRKHFEQTPSSHRIREGSQLALPCVPPLAHPSPTIQWSKNGELITPDNYRIIASDGSLLLSSARLHDEGNYVCTARNVAASRSAPPASIHVYVDGGWSEWTEWSGQCNVDCHQLTTLIRLRGPDVIPTLSRRRVCNNPTPLNGGMTCGGYDEESSACVHHCSLDGGWSEWEGWTQCSSLCSSNRIRHCSRPSPLNGGRFCEGEGVETMPCSEGVCSSQWWISDGLVVIFLFVVFLLLSVLFSLCIVLLCRQKKHPIYGESAAYKSGVIVEGMGGPYLQSPLPSMTILSTKSGYARCESVGYSMSRGGESRQALIDGSSTSSSGRKTFIATKTTSLEEESNYASVYDYVGGELSDNSLSTRGDCVLHARVDKEGGRLTMGKCGVNLLIGESSLDFPTLIILSVQSPSDHLPMLNDGESPVSSLISITSSSSISPRFPFVLSFSHSLQSIEQWSISLYSHSHYGWDQYDVNSDTVSPFFTLFDTRNPSIIHCTIPHYGKFFLCARPKVSDPILRTRISVFTPMDRRESFPLRVEMMAEGRGMSREEEGERLVAQSSMAVIMKEGGKQVVCVGIEQTSTSFTALNNYTEIDLSEQSSQSFQIDSSDRNVPFSARFVFFQKDELSSAVIVSVTVDDDYDQLVLTEDTRVSLDFILPQSVKQRIASILDPPSDRDWTSLARSLDSSSFIPFGRSLVSPTTVLLSLWEARKEDCCHLSHALRLSGRPDIAHIIDQYIR